MSGEIFVVFESKRGIFVLEEFLDSIRYLFMAPYGSEVGLYIHFAVVVHFL